MDEEEEQESHHYWRVIEAFKTFSTRSRRALRHHFDDISWLENEDLDLIPEYEEKLEELNEVILEVNQLAFYRIIEGALTADDGIVRVPPPPLCFWDKFPWSLLQVNWFTTTPVANCQFLGAILPEIK
jgi:hypothetical protein